jgi:hypothetical protein
LTGTFAFHCCSTNVPNAIDASGRLAPPFTGRSRSFEKNLRLASRGKIRDGLQHLPPTNLPDRSFFEEHVFSLLNN